MHSRNQTSPRPIILLGFHVFYHFRIPLFLLIFILYSLILIGNVMIIALVSTSPSLHHPIEVTLAFGDSALSEFVSLSDILLTTNIVPLMPCGILRGEVTLSVVDCITQVNFCGIALTSESFLLAVMSYDRYLAICNPLRYILIMDKKLCLQLVSLCWFLSVTISIAVSTLISKLPFCGPNIIDHFF
ncbi:hypothetical protein XELAEV_18042682mg [Xenopus laevis]|uniref:G-protein coupled receptors family 1 profile domain-containing protein n=1 Tax=Xenopus laevis TaxID=8355 RepID=A0A974C4Q6_XENLA|nr:hypothetical protein XELAEV_18042682mg [Xenopus laevis]